MKSFSEELVEDRAFEVGGETFKWRYPQWEEMAAIYDEDFEILRKIEVPQPNGSSASGEEDAEALADALAEQTPSVVETTALTLERIILFIEDEDDAHARFRALTERKENAIPPFLIGYIYRWLLEMASGGRPMMPLSVSEAGGGDTEASSPDASSSPEEIPAA